ncbi:MAG: ATP-binding protein [Spirochaetaceae bacterium]|nr:ATP-binding protein [Spirochaetaceae bacterium]
MNSSLSRPAVLVTGARQTGKSSLLKNIFNTTEYITFDHLKYVEQAKESPEHFLKQLKQQVILDEIQYVPEIFRELKIEIDKDRQNYGKWLLTGSQQFELMEGVSESLAGRISIIHLETLSALELRGAKISQMDEHLWKGGYPELWSNEFIEAGDFFESYIRTYIERDLKNIIEVKNLNDFRKLFKTLATRTGQLINYRDISKDIGVADVTIKSWIHALQVSGIIYLLPPYFSNIGKRLTKSPKLYFADHGLACYLLGIETFDEWHSHIYKGNLWENFVMMELIKTHSLIPGESLFFYRDQNGVEIDFVIEKKGTLFFIEAKAQERIDSKKLNFNKVIPLFKNKYKTEAILAQNISDKKVLKLGEYSCYNPLNCSYSISPK